MSDLDPAIWDNKTLGKAANNTRLDVIEKQDLEDRNAKIEGREPREVIVDNDFPGWQYDQNSAVPSTAPVVHFADENPNDIPTTGVTEPEGESDTSEPETIAPEDESTSTWS